MLAREGMHLVHVACSGSLLEELAHTLPTSCLVHAIDLPQTDAPDAVIAATIARFSRIDVLVNSAAATKRGDFLTLPESDWTDGFALKFFGTMRMCRAAWPHLQVSRGAIINIIGVGGRTANAEFTIGGSVNAALLNFTKALADRGVTDNVRVNAINPDSIATERLETRIQLFANTQGIAEDAAAQGMAAALKVARFGEPIEIAQAVAWLASPLSAYCQGAILAVDWGQTRTI